jgi:putative phosphoribosyl transferase
MTTTAGPRLTSEQSTELFKPLCAITPEYFQAVGQFYEDFSQTTDEEVRELVARAAQQS